MAKNKLVNFIHFSRTSDMTFANIINCGYFGCPWRFGDSSNIGTVDPIRLFVLLLKQVSF